MACNKRYIMNAGDPFGSRANRPINYDTLILRHKMGNQDTELGRSLPLIETVDTGRAAGPQQKGQHPKVTGESDHLIVLRDGRADHTPTQSNTDGSVIHPHSGTPQGGVISPMLANIYLHYGVDLWFEKVVKSQSKGQAHIIRFADDCVPRTLSVGPRLKSPCGTPNNSHETSIRESDGHDSACLKKLEESWVRVGGAVRKMGVCWSPETGLQEQVSNHLELH